MGQTLEWFLPRLRLGSWVQSALSRSPPWNYIRSRLKTTLHRDAVEIWLFPVRNEPPIVQPSLEVVDVGGLAKVRLVADVRRTSQATAASPRCPHSEAHPRRVLRRTNRPQPGHPVRKKGAVSPLALRCRSIARVVRDDGAWRAEPRSSAGEHLAWRGAVHGIERVKR